MIKTVEKYPIISLVLFVVLMLGLTIDALPVTIMEARNFISAREMLSDNNWILTTMNGDARYEKPPLPTWITAFFGSIFGMSSVLALRWPALLMVACIGITTYLFSKQLLENRAHSLINGFLVVTSFYVIGIIVEAPWDIYAHGFMLVAVYQLFLCFKNKTVRLKNSLLFSLFFAASLLSKGPVSIYALFLPFLISYGITYGFKDLKINYLKYVVLLVFATILGAWWYVFIRFTDPETFIRIASRETANWSSYNVRPIYYYWSFFVQSGLWTIPAFISLLYPYLKTRVINLKAYRFTLLWTLIAVILLSIIPEKKSRYLMPVLIPLAINMGFYIEYLIRKFKTLTSKKEIYPVYFNFGLIGAIALLFPVVGFFIKDHLNGLVFVNYSLAALVLITIGVFIIIALRVKNIKLVFYAVQALMLCVGMLALPLHKVLTQTDYNPISKLAKTEIAVFSIDEISPEVIYNFGDKIPNIVTAEGLKIPTEKQFYILTNSNTDHRLNLLLDSHKIQFVEVLDLNTSKKESRAYKDRLVNYLYKLKLE
jgi:4-amino-4-deoxy-L-arabinose transferase-like glycosyltransferase